MNSNPLHQEMTRHQFEIWLRDETTQRLLSNLCRMRDTRHAEALSARVEPVHAAQRLEREFRLIQLISYIKDGQFILPTNQQTLDNSI